MRLSNANGFKLEVSVADGVPHVRISTEMKEGIVVVLDTDRLSSSGLENLSEVCRTAAKMAFEELDLYWMRQHQQIQ